MLKKIIIILIIILIIPITIFTYQRYKNPINNLTNIETENITIDDQEIEVSKDINLIEKQEEYNSDIIGRLEIPSLFNILIVQGKNNSYYLNHSLTQNKDKRGTEFMDYRVTTNSKQINIYGHNSHTYNLPFRKLEKFLSEDFFNQNKYIFFQTSNIKRTYQIIAVKIIENDKEHLIVDLTGSNFTKHLEKLISNSTYQREVEYNENSNILVLQTCSYNKTNSYLLVIAIEI